jgi:hypothetical protein
MQKVQDQREAQEKEFAKQLKKVEQESAIKEQ